MLVETAGDDTSCLEVPALSGALGNGGEGEGSKGELVGVEGPGLGLISPCRRSALARIRRNKYRSERTGLLSAGNELLTVKRILPPPTAALQQLTAAQYMPSPTPPSPIIKERQR